MRGTRFLKMAARFSVRRFQTLHPYEVQASLLNACNLRCLYCRCPDVKTRLLTAGQWRTIIVGLASLGTMRIKFQGGEPTLRPDFRELCNQVQIAGIRSAVVTNGLEVARRPELLDYLDEIVLSLDSATPEIHDKLRGDGSHAAVVSAIDLARKRKVKTYINMVVHRENLAELEPMLEFCTARDISMHAQPVMFGRQYYDEVARGLALTEDQTRQMHRQLTAWKRAGRPLMFSPLTYERTAVWKDYSELTVRSPGASNCMAGRFYVHIEPNGDVHPCAIQGAAFEPKNIIEDGLPEALRHAQTHDCGDCSSAYLNERKALFALKPWAVWQLLRRG